MLRGGVATPPTNPHPSSEPEPEPMSEEKKVRVEVISQKWRSSPRLNFLALLVLCNVLDIDCSTVLNGFHAFCAEGI